MQMFQEMQQRGHQSLSLVTHAPSGLNAVLAVHSTVLGPAIAGCRLMDYQEDRALRDALSLSESLTLKAALAGLNLGGGACVILAPEGGLDSEPHLREALFRALGRRVAELGGRLILTEDVGVTGFDIAYAAQETSSTLGMHTDTPAITAYGVYRGIKAAARHYLSGESMRGVRVAVLGAGSVGRALARHLVREGARVTLADVRPEKAQALADELGEGVQLLSAEAIFDTPCDVFSPCGFGHSIRRAQVERLQCRIIAGGEHHPLSRFGAALAREAGIAYVPDFAVNAAGLIAAASGVNGEEAAERVYNTVSRICAEAVRLSRSPDSVGRALAMHRIELIGSLGSQGGGSQGGVDRAGV